jgi:hypothetical protein
MPLFLNLAQLNYSMLEERTAEVRMALAQLIKGSRNLILIFNVINLHTVLKLNQRRYWPIYNAMATLSLKVLCRSLKVTDMVKTCY